MSTSVKQLEKQYKRAVLPPEDVEYQVVPNKYVVEYQEFSVGIIVVRLQEQVSAEDNTWEVTEREFSSNEQQEALELYNELTAGKSHIQNFLSNSTRT